MREIKFRAWDGEKFWYKNSIMHELWNTDDRVQKELIKFNTTGFIIEQFTGLTDKSGKEIYEGDILKYSNEAGHHSIFSELFVVEFGEQDFGDFGYQQTIGFNATRIDKFGKPSGMDSGRLSNGILNLFGTHNVEVIGNIHKNKELLK